MINTEREKKSNVCKFDMQKSRYRSRDLIKVLLCNKNRLFSSIIDFNEIFGVSFIHGSMSHASMLSLETFFNVARCKFYFFEHDDWFLGVDSIQMRIWETLHRWLIIVSLLLPITFAQETHPGIFDVHRREIQSSHLIHMKEMTVARTTKNNG